MRDEKLLVGRLINQVCQFDQKRVELLNLERLFRFFGLSLLTIKVNICCIWPLPCHCRLSQPRVHISVVSARNIDIFHIFRGIVVGRDGHNSDEQGDMAAGRLYCLHAGKHDI
jgi:hypothetical protein